MKCIARWTCNRCLPDSFVGMPNLWSEANTCTGKWSFFAIDFPINIHNHQHYQYQMDTDQVVRNLFDDIALPFPDRFLELTAGANREGMHRRTANASSNKNGYEGEKRTLLFNPRRFRPWVMVRYSSKRGSTWSVFVTRLSRIAAESPHVNLFFGLSL